MNKKFCLIIGSFLMLITFVTLLWGKQLKNTVAVSKISQEQQEELLNEKIISETLEFQLLFMQERVPYDALTNTYYLPQIAEEAWQWEDVFTLSDKDLRLQWCEDAAWKDMKSAIAQGHSFQFIVSNESEVKFGNIVFTGLPMMRLETQKILGEDASYCRVTIFDPFHNNSGLYEITNCYGYLELRGKTSQMFPKKGWNLSLVKESDEPYKTALFGLREDDDWKLNALYPDASKVREMIAMELWNEMAEQTELPYDAGTRMEYFELLTDGDYRGIYGAMEQLDYKQFSLDKTEDVIYKGYAWPREGNIDVHALDGAADFCGHLIKTFDRPISAELWQPFVEYAAAANFADEELKCDTEVFYQYLKEHMNMDNFLHSELFVQLLYAFDNKYKNLYIVADRREGGDYTLWKIPWDLNYSFGDRYSAEGNALTAYDLEWSREIMPEFMMSETLLKSGNQEFARTLNEKWEELRSGILSVENVECIAKEKMACLQTSGAYARDAKRWPDGPHDTSLEKILEFHSSRLKFLDEHYASYLNEN